MTDHDALLRAVCEFPDDDTPRLVYADWLDQHAGTVVCGTCGGSMVEYLGGSATKPCRTCSGTGSIGNGYAARAEFVWVQCELARPCTACGGDGEYDADHRRGKMTCQLCFGAKTLSGPQAESLRARERELWMGNCTSWFASLQQHLCVALVGEDACSLPNHGFPSRGFLSSIALPAAEFTEALARAVFGAQPVTEIVISDAVFTQRPGWGWCGYENRLPQPCVDPRKMLGHRTEADARLALSDELVAWARGLVGLPPVTRAAGTHNGGR